jgi:hypothetical protein
MNSLFRRRSSEAQFRLRHYKSDILPASSRTNDIAYLVTGEIILRRNDQRSISAASSRQQGSVCVVSNIVFRLHCDERGILTILLGSSHFGWVFSNELFWRAISNELF